MPHTLGELVAQERQKRGLTQASLASHLVKMAGRTRLKKAGLATEAGAVRTWLAKLESGKLRRDIGDRARGILAEVLNPEEQSAFKALLVYQKSYIHHPDRPEEFLFDELWVLTQEPLECRQPGYARSIVRRWADHGDAPIVYFVPLGGVAKELAAAMRTAATGNRTDTAAVRRNLRIEEVSPAALALVPHLILWFDAGLRNGYDGFVEQLPGDANEEREWGTLPRRHLDRIVRFLEQAQLLGPDLRHVKAPAGTIRRGADVEFKVFDVEAMLP